MFTPFFRDNEKKLEQGKLREQFSSVATDLYNVNVRWFSRYVD